MAWRGAILTLALLASGSARAATFARTGDPEAVNVSGPARTIYLWGAGAEDEDSTESFHPAIRHPGDFAGQCAYAMDKVRRLLATQQAAMGDIVRMTTYVTDARWGGAYDRCVEAAFVGGPRPAHTVVNISQLAHPGMLLEVSVIAMRPADPKAAFAKTADHYQAKWSGGSAEVVTVSGPDQTLYLSGMNAGLDRAGQVSGGGDVMAQCRLTFERIRQVLTSQGADFGDMVRTNTLVVGDIPLADLRPCTNAAFKASPRRATGAFLNLTGFADRDMMFGYDVTAAIADPALGASFRRRAVKVLAGAPDGPDAVTVSGPRRMVFLSGIDAAPGGGFADRCRAAFQAAEGHLNRQGARLSDAVKVTAYLADMRWSPAYRTCLDAVFGKGTRPAIAMVGVTRPILPGSRLTLEITAAVADTPGR